MQLCDGAEGRGGGGHMTGVLLHKRLSDGWLAKRAGVVAGEETQSCVSVTADTSGSDRWGLFIYWGGGQRQEGTFLWALSEEGPWVQG